MNVQFNFRHHNQFIEQNQTQLCHKEFMVSVTAQIYHFINF